YIEWFTSFPALPEPNHSMYQISRSKTPGGDHLVSIEPLKDIHCSIHLLPKFGKTAAPTWTSSTVLDSCPKFFVNSFTDMYIYRTIF
ncbi:hypothetical protein BDZ94DRAFT_1179654, partial [Collybia nuda]